MRRTKDYNLAPQSSGAALFFSEPKQMKTTGERGNSKKKKKREMEMEQEAFGHSANVSERSKGSEKHNNNGVVNNSRK